MLLQPPVTARRAPSKRSTKAWPGTISPSIGWPEASVPDCSVQTLPCRLRTSAGSAPRRFGVGCDAASAAWAGRPMARAASSGRERAMKDMESPITSWALSVSTR